MPRSLGRGRACLPLPCRNAHQMFHQTPRAPRGSCLPQQPPSPPALPGRAVPGRAGGGGPAGGGGWGVGGAGRNVSSCCCRPLPPSCQNALEEIHSHLPEQGSPRRDVTPRRGTMAPRPGTGWHVWTPPPPCSPRDIPPPPGSARLGLPRCCPGPGGLFAGSERCKVCLSFFRV